ncbi:unnamed protein product [Aphanomyces euteiches]
MVNEVADVWTESLDLQEYVVYPVTPLQAGMLFSTMSKRSAYVMQYSLLLGDDLTAEMACEGYRRVARQHEILRTTFVSLSSGLVQIIRSDIAEPSVLCLAWKTISRQIMLVGLHSAIGALFALQLCQLEVKNMLCSPFTMHYMTVGPFHCLWRISWMPFMEDRYPLAQVSVAL